MAVHRELLPAFKSIVFALTLRYDGFVKSIKYRLFVIPAKAGNNVFVKLSEFYHPAKGEGMPQKILIAVDDSENAQRAVAFVARSFSRDHQVTLLNVMIDTAALCHMDSPELTPLFKEHQSSFCILEEKKHALIKQAMKKAKETLEEAGFSPDGVEIRIETKKQGVARDILAEAHNGHDLIVLGRRGISGIKDFFMGSTAHKVFNGAKELSVLIVS
jgi:nucleotide-binding universal stress UspA family protein